jgi:outer membrane protein
MRRTLALFFTFIICCSAFAEEKTNHSWDSPGIPSAPGKFWPIPPGEPPKLTGATPLPAPPEIQNKLDWTLTDLIDFALSTAYSTKESWNTAKAAEYEFRSKKGKLYPEVDLSANLSRVRSSAVGGQFTFKQNSFQPGATVSWILFDFGKRRGDIDEARKLLLSADFSHNAEVQNLILEVQRAYYGYIGSKALLEAQDSSVKRAQTDVDAAQQRHDAGLATIADVLQAQTQLSQAEFDAATTRGQIQILRGTLAIAIGIPPSNVKFEVVDQLPQDLPLDAVSKEILVLIEEGFKRRPELLALKADALAAEAHARSTRGDRFPSISLNANANNLWYLAPYNNATNYSAALSIDFPLFDGFSRKNDYFKAKAQADEAKARVASFQQQVGLQIWISYFQLNTSSERIKTTRKLLESAEQSYDVASGRYKEGVGSILDVLAAQSALEQARAQDVQTRTEWLLSLAQLYHDMGLLGHEKEFSVVGNSSVNQDVNK